MVKVVVTIHSPPPGTEVPRTIVMTGSIALDPPRIFFGRGRVSVTLGGIPAGVATVSQLGSWQYSHAVPAAIPDGTVIQVAVEGNALYKDRANDPEPKDADPGTDQLQVQVESRPPELTMAPDFPTDVITDTVPFPITIHGTTSGPQSGITEVRWSVEDGSSGLAENMTPPGDWTTWRAVMQLDGGDHRFTVTARDSRGRSASVPGAVSIHRTFESSDPAHVFGPAIYLRELCDLAARNVRIASLPTGPDRATLAARFHQPFDRLTKSDGHTVAAAPVLQQRVANEVLRRSLDAPVPAALDRRWRALAYESLLRELGTSASELRQVRRGDRADRLAVAARLGIDLDDIRPDRLDELTVSPDEITDAQLEALFGFRPISRVDPFAPPGPPPALGGWRQASLRRMWHDDDIADRDGLAGSLPVIDPDHVGPANLRAQRAGDPTFDILTERQVFVRSVADSIDGTVRRDGATLATFDRLIAGHIGALDVAALADRDDRGENIAADLVAVALDRTSFRYLASARHQLGGGELIASDWADVRDILIGVEKRHEAAAWRKRERDADIVLTPEVFVADPPEEPPAPADTEWRVGAHVHLIWQSTLRARTGQLDRLRADDATVLDAAEATVLPRVRDELLGLIGDRRQPAESASAAAERLTRELCIDLQSQVSAPTTRADQAAETLLAALLSLRSGQLPSPTGQPVWIIGREAEFDAAWAFMSAFNTWHGAIRSFAYPENHLLPGLYLPDGLHLTPSESFHTTFLADLRAKRVTPQRARDLSRQHWERISELDPAFRAIVESLAPLTERHTNDDLGRVRDALAPKWAAASDPHRQLMREIFWLIPVALARSLQDEGQFTVALDWFQWAYAYQLPSAQRRIFAGLVTEQSGSSTYDRPPDWPVDGSNPHEVARHRSGAYTRFTLLSIVECLLALGDSEFVRNTSASNARARTIYQTALDLIDSPDAAPQVGPTVPFPPNPVWEALDGRARTALDKIHRGLNIAAAPAAPDERVSVLPSQYRYSVLAERARLLVTTAQQIEAQFLSAAIQRDNEAYTAIQAGRDLAVASAMLGVEDLKVTAAGFGVKQAQVQQERAITQSDHFSRLIADGLSGHERDQLSALRSAQLMQEAAAAFGLIGALASSGPTGVVAGLANAATAAAGALSTEAQIAGLQAGYERRRQEWQLQQALARKDIEIGRHQIVLAGVQERIARAERAVAGIQLAHAAATADFLATKFTNTELFDWMAGVLNRVYAYFLQQATAVARLAQAQLAFERQEPLQGLIQDDYWQGPPDPSTGTNDSTDRRGLTGSARLLQDIFRLDQYAFDTDRRKLHLTQTVSLARTAAIELERFRQTGVLVFATRNEMLDREFPGHYLRLIRKVGVTMVALVPSGGIRAELSASGVSRTVVAAGPFEMVTLRRDPESIAFTSALNATGRFELEPDNAMLGPFEGMGIEAVWRLDVPKAANPFDYRTVADVQLTFEYTALVSTEYRRKVIRTLDPEFRGERAFSLRSQFPDVWYDLHNPDTVRDPARTMVAVLPLTAEDFPRHVADLNVTELTLFAVRNDELTEELTVTKLRHVVQQHAVEADAVSTVEGIAGTRRPGGERWRVFVGDDPTGTWELHLDDNDTTRSWFRDDQIDDLVFAVAVAGSAPAWN